MPIVTKAIAANHSLLAGWYGNFVEDERALDARRDADPRAAVRVLCTRIADECRVVPPMIDERYAF